MAARSSRVAGLFGAATVAVLSLLAPATGRASQTVSIQSGQTGPVLLIEGSSGADHVELRISASGQRFTIRGNFQGRAPRRCTRRRGGGLESCRIGQLSGVEVRLGESGDKVEVLETLPVPLTARLGSGSDKMLGAGEPNLCYTGGTDRNRCIGGGGNDVCVGGRGNDDCVGGPGTDYCKALAGSDGCWGGPGRDVCVMGPGRDGCHGDAGGDRLYGGSSPDQLYGGPGRDYCDGARDVGRSHACEAGPRR